MRNLIKKITEIGALRIGDKGWVVPWALFHPYWHLYPAHPVSAGTVAVLIEMTEDGPLVVDFADDYAERAYNRIKESHNAQ